MSMSDQDLTTLAKAVRRIKEIQANPPPADPRPLTKKRLQELFRMVNDARAKKH